MGAPLKSTHQKREQHVSRLRYERQTPSHPSLAERSRTRWVPRVAFFRLARAPVMSSKCPNPLAYSHLARGTRGTLRQDGEPRGPLTVAPAPADRTDVTMHSQQEHGNHALT
jgi:hypothetical protein